MTTTLLDDSYEFPPPSKRGPKSLLKPAILMAIENPGRAVLVTELGTVASASARLSDVRKKLSAGVPGQPDGAWEAARDDRKIVIRFMPGPKETPLDPRAGDQ